MQQNKSLRAIGVISALFIVLACSLFTAPPMEPVPVTPFASPTALPEILEPTAPAPIVNLPNGFVTRQDDILSVHDTAGNLLFQLQPPNLNAGDLHIAAPLIIGSNNLPIIYNASREESSLVYYDNGQATTLKNVDFYVDIVGAQSMPFIAYVATEYTDSGLISNLYVGSPQTLANAPSQLYDLDPASWALSVLAVDMEDSTPSGIWYTKIPWGIGGDIVYAPYRTLAYLDLNSGTAYQYLGDEANPSDLSRDRSWVAYTNDTSVDAGSAAMTARSLVTGETVTYPLVDAVNQRGAGEAKFSPTTQYLAWMEASGWQMAEVPDFHSLVRVGDLQGNVIAQFADTAFLSVSGLGSVQRVQPVGWLNDNTLLVMARSEDWDDAAIIAIDIPTQGMRLLAKGVFVDFTYAE